MNGYTLDIHDTAAADIREIVNYLNNILYSKQAAFQFLDSLEKKYKSIAKEPHLFPKEWIKNSFYHKAMIKQYVLIFQIEELTKTVHIIAVGHSLQKRSHLIKRR